MKKQRSRNLFFQLLCCVGLIAWTNIAFAQKSQNIVIQGDAKFAVGKTIRLIVFDDFVTYRTHVAASDVVDKNGNFKLSYHANEMHLAQIAINTSKAELYLEPQKSYHFSIDMDPQLFQLLDPMEYGGFLQIRNTDSTSKSDINLKINHFEYVMDRLSAYYFDNEPTQDKFDTLTDVLSKQFPIRYVPTDFYQSYLFYSFASLERVFMQKNIDSLYHKYLENEYILYNNPAYMSFFCDFYDNYLYTSPHINRQNLIECINNEGNYLSLFNEVGKDSYLVNEEIREMVILQNLMQLFDNSEFSKKNIIAIITEIGTTTHFPEHRVIAQNVIYTLQHLRAGATISTADLKAANGTQLKLEKMKGKWVYIQFFNSTCEDCIREMMIIKELQKKYADEIDFVSISTDFNVNLFIQFKDYYRQFDWQFAHFNDQFEWLNELEITTLPDNILISPDGKLAQRYAPDITRELAGYLARLFKKEEKEVNPLSPHEKK